MALIDYKSEIAVLTTVCTILQYLSGVLVCWKFIKKGSSNDVSPLPFLCGVTSSALWVGYAYVVTDGVIFVVNSTGFLLMVCYILTHTAYCTKKGQNLKKMLMVFISLCVVHIYLRSVEDRDVVRNYLGFLGCTMSIIYMSAPLSDLAKVIKMRSSEILPFPLIVMSMVVSTLWTTYGLILEDDFLIYPNALGCVVSAFQLSLFVKYPAGPR